MMRGSTTIVLADPALLHQYWRLNIALRNFLVSEVDVLEQEALSSCFLKDRIEHPCLDSLLPC